MFAGLGRITQMVSQDGTSTYGYDSKSQLTSATHSYQSNETYTFDQNGNRTMTGYQTGTDNRLTNDGTYSYQYDAEGNRTRRTKTGTGEVTEYEWDYRNRLVKVTEKNAQGTVTQVVEYVYDVFDRRIGRKLDTTAPFNMADAVIERYVLDDIHNGLVSADGGNVVLDFVDPDGSGAQPMALSKRYLYGEAVDQLLAQEDLSKTLGDAARNLWPLVDHLQTVRDLAKQDGTIAVHYKYDSFGRVTSGDTSKTRYLFTSREFDPATGLQYNRARWYDPRVGGWLSEDPLGFVAGDGNLQRYVRNEPTRGMDPSGMQPPDVPTPGVATIPGTQDFGYVPSHLSGFPAWKAPSREKVLEAIPVRQLDSIPRPSDAPTVGRVRSGEYWVGIIPSSVFVGPFGCGTCVGVILSPPKSSLPTFVFHFRESDSVRGGLYAAGGIERKWYPTLTGSQVSRDFPLLGYSVVICGGNREGTNKLHEVITIVKEIGYPARAYVPTSSVYVSDTQGLYLIDAMTMSNKEYE